MGKNEKKDEKEIINSKNKLENTAKTEENNNKKDVQTSEEKGKQQEQMEENKTAVAVLDKNEEISETKNEEKKNKKPEQKKQQPDIDTDIKENTEQETYKFKKASTAKKKHKFVVLLIVILIVLAILALLSCTIFALINSSNNKILNGISIRNTLVEGLTEEEALNMLSADLENERKQQIALKIDEQTFSITPEQIGVQYNIEKAIEEAYNIGRNGNIFQNNFEILGAMLKENNIEIEFTYEEELLDNILKEFSTKLQDAMVDNTYRIEEDKLIITRGKAGLVIDTNDAKKLILDSIKTGNNKEIELKTEYMECPEIDIDKIYSEVKTEPQNATYKKDPFEIIPHKNGIDFNVEEAKQIISEEKEEYIINLIITEPEVLTNEIGEEAFPDLLSSFSTKYDESNVSRSTNLKIAMSKLNGVVVMPGEVCSYNETLGERTVAEGYKYANGFAGGKVVPMLAGGICQISSTLYDAVLYANLEIVERHNHMFQAEYVEPGKDATVVYGSLDFKFKNTRQYPIMIKTTCQSGVADIKIFGIKEEVEYEVEVVTTILNYTPYDVIYQNDSSLAAGQQRVSQYGLQGCKSQTYRIIKLNGQEVSRELLSTDTYSPLDKIVRRGYSAPVQPTTPQEQTPVEQEPPIAETPTEPEKPAEEIPEEPITPEKPEEENPVETEEPTEPENSIE